MATLDSNIVDVIDVEPRHLKMVQSVLARHLPYKIVWAYGSRVKWNASETSDLDLVVFDATDREISNAKEAFDESEIPFEVQLLNWQKIPDDFKQNIEKKYFVLRRKEDWRECRLIDIFELIGGGTPKTNNPDYWNGDIPWLSVADFNTGNKFVCDAEKSITQLGLEKSSTRILNKGDIIISARGTVGVVAMLGRDMAFNQSCYGVRANQQSTNEFVYYLLKYAVNKLQQISHGGVFDTITRDTFKEIILPLPPLPEQKAIAEVLGCLDDKIDLLHRQNKTLESLAESLFRQWFIEGASEEWKEVKLGDVVKVIDNRGKTPPYQDIPTPYPIIEVNALTGKNRLVDYASIRKYVTNETFNTWFRGHPKKFDSLISTVGSIGEISMFVVEKGSIAQNVIALHPIKISPFYLFEFLKYVKDEIKELDIGSVQPSIKVPHLLSIKITIPSTEKLDLFDNEMRSFLSKMLVNYNQIRTLETLRNNLLPKLMSGDVRIGFNNEI